MSCFGGRPKKPIIKSTVENQNKENQDDRPNVKSQFPKETQQKSTKDYDNPRKLVEITDNVDFKEEIGNCDVEVKFCDKAQPNDLLINGKKVVKLDLFVTQKSPNTAQDENYWSEEKP